MSENVNKKVVDKIKKSDLDESIKNFLIYLFRAELRHYDKQKWNYGDEYDGLIKELVDKEE